MFAPNSLPPRTTDHVTSHPRLLPGRTEWLLAQCDAGAFQLLRNSLYSLVVTFEAPITPMLSYAALGSAAPTNSGRSDFITRMIRVLISVSVNHHSAISSRRTECRKQRGYFNECALVRGSNTLPRCRDSGERSLRTLRPCKVRTSTAPKAQKVSVSL